jgi:hypothetical protein
MKMMRDPGRELKRMWRRHHQRVKVCGCPECDDVVQPLGQSRTAEKRRWKRDQGEPS